MWFFTKRLSVEKDVTPDDSVPRLEHKTMQEQLEGEVNHLTQLLQGALRKQDEMALEAADAWQKVRRKRRRKNNFQMLTHYAQYLHSHHLIQPSGAGESSRAGSPAGAGDVEGEGEPDADLQTG